MSNEPVDPTRSPVLLIGASCRSAAAALHRVGIDAEAWDMYADRDTQLYCRAVHEISAIDEVQLVEVFERPRSIILPCGGLENHAELWSKLSTQHIMLGPSEFQLQKLRDPFWLSEYCNANDLRMPLTMRLENAFPQSSTPLVPSSGRSSEYNFTPLAPSSGRSSENNFTPLAPSSGRGVGGEGLSSQDPTKRSLLKQQHSGGGLKVHEISQLPENFIAPQTAYLQEFVSGQELSLTIGCTEAGKSSLIVAMGSAKQLRRQNQSTLAPFLYQGSFGPITLDPNVERTVLEFFDRLTRSLQFVGVLQADMIQNAEGVFLLEINPRWTASMELAELYQVGSIVSQFRSQQGIGLSITRQVIGDRAKYTKLICYASETIQVDTEMSDSLFELLSWSNLTQCIERMNALQIDIGEGWQDLDRGSCDVRLADIPRHEIEIQRGQPICSLLIREYPKN